MSDWRDVPMPERIAALPRDHRGFPVPWFVAWIDDKPHFPTMSEQRLQQAIEDDRCWICGHPIEGPLRAYVVGPMCAVNRTSGEPPSHEMCADYAARACPFLANPDRARKPRIEGQREPAGRAIYRNPGVALVWVTRGTRLKDDGRGGLLFDIGDPVLTRWYAHGGAATREEAEASMDSGVELLREVAEEQGPGAVLKLAEMVAAAKRLLPTATVERAPDFLDVTQTDAHNRACGRLLAADGSVFLAFDQLDCGLTSEQMTAYCAWALTTIPEEFRARMTGMVLATALTVVEADRERRF